MAFDAHKNLAVGSVVTPPAPATSGTSLTVGAGEGARFPAVPFNVTVWSVDMPPSPVTAEVIRVTARTGDTLSGLVRASEGTTARTILAGDAIAATITAQSLTDIESGTNFPLITTAGGVTAGGDVLFSKTGDAFIATATADGADTRSVTLGGGGPDVGGTARANRGGQVSVYGNDYAGFPGNINIQAGTIPGPNGKIIFQTNDTSRGVMHSSGGFSWGGTTDPGAGNLSVAGHVLTGTIRQSTTAGVLTLSGGSDIGTSAYLNLYGSTSSGTGSIEVIAAGLPGITLGAQHAGGVIKLLTATVERGRIHASGGFSWGGTVDPGAGGFLIGPGKTDGQAFIWCYNDGTFANVQIGGIGTAFNAVMYFKNANGPVGSITTSGTSTSYVTTSDARLKTSLGPHTDLDVLRRTVIHDFTWRTDGTTGRGVFAQEAHAVAPFAVSVGTDARDADGRLSQPWGVDYAKYVPDLITGWQHHDHILAQYDHILVKQANRIDALERTVFAEQPMGVINRIRLAIRRVFAWWTPVEVTP